MEKCVPYNRGLLYWGPFPYILLLLDRIIWSIIPGCLLYLLRSRKYPYSPHRRDWIFLGGWWISKVQKFKAMYVAKLEFPDRANPFHGGGREGIDISWNYTYRGSLGSTVCPIGWHIPV